MRPQDLGWALEHPGLRLVVVIARGVTIGPASAALDAELAAAVAAAVAAAPAASTAQRRAAVRDLLRFGGFKPTGRSKPASEYLLGAAERGEFPRVNNVVDVANALSVAQALPVSLLDLDLALGGAPGLEVRFGRAGESYVFNRAGQEIDLAGLVVVARAGGEAVGNAVKDALAAKTTAETRNLIGIVYAPAAECSVAELAVLGDAFAASLVRHGGGEAFTALRSGADG